MKNESKERKKGAGQEKLSFVEKSIISEQLFTLLDNQYELDPEERKALWKLYLSMSKHRQLLLTPGK